MPGGKEGRWDGGSQPASNCKSDSQRSARHHHQPRGRLIELVLGVREGPFDLLDSTFGHYPFGEGV